MAIDPSLHRSLLSPYRIACARQLRGRILDVGGGLGDYLPYFDGEVVLADVNHEALRQAEPVFGCEPYLTENAYREKLQHGRITLQEIQEVLDEDLGDSAAESIAGITTRGNLRKDMLQYPLHTGPTTDLRWIVAETDALRRFRSEMPLDARERIVQETQHWVMRDLSGQLKSEQFSNALGDDIAPALRELADQFTLAVDLEERWIARVRGKIADARSNERDVPIWDGLHRGP